MMQRACCKKRTRGSVVAAGILAALVGVLLLGGTDYATHNQGGRTCPFTRTNACATSVAQHVLQWQHTFYFSPTLQTILLWALAALAAALGAARIPARVLAACVARQNQQTALLLHSAPPLPLRDPLRQALAKGIVHPRVW